MIIIKPKQPGYSFVRITLFCNEKSGVECES